MREIHCYDYVTHPYEEVRAALSDHALQIFQVATHAASERAAAVAPELHIKLGGLDVATEIKIEVQGIEEQPRLPKRPPKTVLKLEWKAVQSPRLFPLMHGELSIYSLTPTETQLDFAGHYEPPMQALGGVIDAVVGHRLAEAAVHRFLGNVAAHLRKTLTG